jgi:Ca2+-binding EF-hand superfamily protein
MTKEEIREKIKKEYNISDEMIDGFIEKKDVLKKIYKALINK